jgi:hypothetical protein
MDTPPVVLVVPPIVEPSTVVEAPPLPATVVELPAAPSLVVELVRVPPPLVELTVVAPVLALPDVPVVEVAVVEPLEAMPLVVAPAVAVAAVGPALVVTDAGDPVAPSVPVAVPAACVAPPTPDVETGPSPPLSPELQPHVCVVTPMRAANDSRYRVTPAVGMCLSSIRGLASCPRVAVHHGVDP